MFTSKLSENFVILKDYINFATNKLESELDIRMNIVAKRCDEIESLKIQLHLLNNDLREKV